MKTHKKCITLHDTITKSWSNSWRSSWRLNLNRNFGLDQGQFDEHGLIDKMRNCYLTQSHGQMRNRNRNSVSWTLNHSDSWSWNEDWLGASWSTSWSLTRTWSRTFMNLYVESCSWSGIFWSY